MASLGNSKRSLLVVSCWLSRNFAQSVAVVSSEGFLFEGVANFLTNAPGSGLFLRQTPKTQPPPLKQLKTTKKPRIAIRQPPPKKKKQHQLNQTQPPPLVLEIARNRSKSTSKSRSQSPPGQLQRLERRKRQRPSLAEPQATAPPRSCHMRVEVVSFFGLHWF